MVKKTDFSVKRNGEFRLEVADFKTLSLLYRPIVGNLAYDLYLTLYEMTAPNPYQGPVILLTDLMANDEMKDQNLNGAIRKLSSFKLVKILSSNAFELFPPYGITDYKNSQLYTYLEEHTSQIEFDYISNQFGWEKAENRAIPSLSVEELSQTIIYKNRKPQPLPFDFKTFKNAAKEAEYLIKEEDKSFFESLATVFNLSLDNTLQLLYETSDDNNIYTKEALINGANDRFVKMQTKNERAKDSTGSDIDHITYIENTKPEVLLKSTNKGGAVSIADYNIIDRLRKDLSLSDELITTLLIYSFVTGDNRVKSYPFFEKIAIDWKRRGITNAHDAYFYINELYTKNMKKVKESSTTEEWFENYWKNIVDEREKGQ